MTDIIIQFLKEVNIVELIAIGGMFWFFYNRIEKKFDKVDVRIDKIEERINKLSDKVDDLDKRLCRIEGSLSSQGHCLFSQNQQQKKAE